MNNYESVYWKNGTLRIDEDAPYDCTNAIRLDLESIPILKNYRYLEKYKNEILQKGDLVYTFNYPRDIEYGFYALIKNHHIGTKFDDWDDDNLLILRKIK